MDETITLNGKTYVRVDLDCPGCKKQMDLLVNERGRPYYRCVDYPKCANSHSARPDGRPMGEPADFETRKARNLAHEEFDKLWKYGLWNRHKAYNWMRLEMGLTDQNGHIGMFNLEQCEWLIRIARRKVEMLCSLRGPKCLCSHPRGEHHKRSGNAEWKSCKHRACACKEFRVGGAA